MLVAIGAVTYLKSMAPKSAVQSIKHAEKSIEKVVWLQVKAGQNILTLFEYEGVVKAAAKVEKSGK